MIFLRYQDKVTSVLYFFMLFRQTVNVGGAKAHKMAKCVQA